MSTMPPIVAPAGSPSPAAAECLPSVPAGRHRSDVIRNSSWGIVSHVCQTVLLSLFFIILAKKYATDEFAKYVIATALAQMISAFSALGLGQWFVREVAGARQDRQDLIVRFLRMQIYSGAVFYAVNVVAAVLLYQDLSIRLIAAVFGLNIIFDNIINALKCLNVADLEQRKTFTILTLEAFLKAAVGCVLFVYPFSILTLCAILLLVRTVTLNLFLRLGTSSEVSARALLAFRHDPFADLRKLVLSNWRWIVIGGVSTVNWRIASIIVSKRLGLAETATYEISYRLFSIAQMLPIIVSTAVFPVLIRMYKAGDFEGFRVFYKHVYLYYLLFGLAAYCCIYSYSDVLIPLAFGARYGSAAAASRGLFLTIIVFPTAFLQANVLLAMKLEVLDMWFNVALLVVNVGVSLVGLHYVHSLLVVNIGLFASFAAFHVLQDAVLIRRRVASLRHVITLHAVTVAVLLSYFLLAKVVGGMFVFPLYWFGVLLVLVSMNRNDPVLRPFFVKAGELIRS